MVKTLIALCAFFALNALAGCSIRPADPLPSDPRSIWCDHNSPRRDAKPETPRRVLDEINKHNALGEKWCGWTA